MIRFIHIPCLLLAAVNSSFSQVYQEQVESRDKGANNPTVVTGKVLIKKLGEKYEICLTVAIHSDLPKSVTEATTVIVLLDDKCEPVWNTSVSCQLKTTVLNGSVGQKTETNAQTKIAAEEFQAASGYLLLVKRERVADPKQMLLEGKKFWKKQVPSWQAVVTAFQELQGTDKAKTIGTLVVRRLK